MTSDSCKSYALSLQRTAMAMNYGREEDASEQVDGKRAIKAKEPRKVKKRVGECDNPTPTQSQKRTARTNEIKKNDKEYDKEFKKNQNDRQEKCRQRKKEAPPGSRALPSRRCCTWRYDKKTSTLYAKFSLKKLEESHKDFEYFMESMEQDDIVFILEGVLTEDEIKSLLNQSKAALSGESRILRVVESETELW